MWPAQSFPRKCKILIILLDIIREIITLYSCAGPVRLIIEEIYKIVPLYRASVVKIKPCSDCIFNTTLDSFVRVLELKYNGHLRPMITDHNIV